MAHHHHLHHPALVARADDVQTVVSIVYVTATATFDGPIGGYITLSPEAPSTSSTEAASTDASDTSTTTATTTSPVIPVRSHRPSHKSQTDSSASTELATSSVESSSLSSDNTSPSSFPATIFVASTVASSPATSFATSRSALASSTAVTSTVAANADSSGMSGGARVGTAIGVSLAVAIGLIFVLVFVFYRRKKSRNESHQEINEYEEKPARRNSRNSVTSRFSLRNSYLKAPRLSLGPLNHIFPVMSEKSSNDSTNPFGDHAAPGVNENNHPMLLQTGPAAAAAVPKPLSIRSDHTPVYKTTSTPPRQPSHLSPGPSNVHRVQLEFKPSMDDELELRPGQLVRMLHEYDDGWALCIRLDRSQQGVVPRTCISKMPLKPRPTGPPGPGMRHGQRNGQRMSPAGSTSSMTSYTSSDSIPRPLSPANGRMRSESNASYLGQVRSDALDGRPRSNSATTFDAPRLGPIGMSPLNPISAIPQSNNMLRKPVPGQAL